MKITINATPDEIATLIKTGETNTKIREAVEYLRSLATPGVPANHAAKAKPYIK